MKKYILFENGIHIVNSHKVVINEKIKEQELFEYEIIDRLDFIDKLIDWISEARNNASKLIMKQDLKMLMNLDCDYLFSSISTNKYIHNKSKEFNNTCLALLGLNESLPKN